MKTVTVDKRSRDKREDAEALCVLRGPDPQNQMIKRFREGQAERGIIHMRRKKTNIVIQ